MALEPDTPNCSNALHVENLHKNQYNKLIICSNLINFFATPSSLTTLSVHIRINVFGRGLADGREESGICDSRWGVPTRDGWGGTIKSQQKQLSFSFIINTNIHTDRLHPLFLFRLCLVLGGAARPESPEHLPAGQISPLHHQLLSVYCEGKKGQSTAINSSWQMGNVSAADLWQTRMFTFTWDSRVILQHRGHLLHLSKWVKCYLQAKLFCKYEIDAAKNKEHHNKYNKHLCIIII